MGLSSSKKTTTNDPWAPAQPYILNGLSSTQQTFDANQPRLQQMSETAQNAFDQIAPQAFGANSMVTNAQNTAQSIAGRGYGANPGASVFSSLMAGTKSPGSYEGIGAGNPALSTLQDISTQQGSAPTDQFYADTLGGKYLNNNPYLDSIVGHANDTSTKALNARFAGSGMGEGVSTPYATALGSALSNNEDTLRYGAYNNELSRMGQIAGQSDAMTNAGADRRLSAANSLGSLSNQTGALNIQAQQAKDAAFNADRSSQLGAAQAADGSYNTQANQALQALGLTPGLADAQYAGVAPALSLLNASATAPYIGVSAYNGGVNGLSNGYGTSTTTSKGSIMDYLLQMQSNAAKAAAAGG